MGTLIAICLVVLTLTHLAGLVLVIVALVQMKRSAEAVEVLAYQAQDQISKFGDTADRVRDFAGAMSSVWLKVLGAALTALGYAWTQRRGKKAPEA